MAIIRKIGGWFLITIGILMLGAIAITLLTAEKIEANTVEGMVAAGGMLGCCPIFLGWVLMRRRPSPPPIRIPATLPQHAPSIAIPSSLPGSLRCEVTMSYADIHHLCMWVHWQNYIIRFMVAGFIVSVFGVLSMINSQHVHWEQLQLQHLLFPLVVLLILFLPQYQAWLIHRSQAGKRRCIYEISAQGIHLENSAAITAMKWDAIPRGIETSKMFVLFSRPPSHWSAPTGWIAIAAIPKHAMASEDEIGKLRATLRIFMPERMA